MASWLLRGEDRAFSIDDDLELHARQVKTIIRYTAILWTARKSTPT